MHASRHRATFALVLTLAVAGCSGAAQNPTLPQTHASHASTQLTIHWSSTATQASAVRKPQFISPSAQSIRVDAMPVGSTDLTQRVTAIVNNGGSATSTVNIDAPIGNDTFTFGVFDQQNAQGTNIGGGAVTQNIVAGTANVVKATLDGYLATLGISSTNPLFVKTAALAGGLPIYAVIGTGAVNITVTPLDADGNVILSGAPAITGASDTSAFTLTPVAGSTNAFALQAVGPMPAGGAARMIFTAPGTTRTFSATYSLLQIGLIYAGAPGHIYSYDTTGTPYALPGGFPGVQMPVGIAYDSGNSRIYIADSGASKILAYDLQGNVATGWTPPSVAQITGVAFSPSSKHVLATSNAGTGSVLVFDTSGAAVANAGFTGLHAPPVGIADGTGDHFIAVVESGNPGYLDIFDTTGKNYPAYSSSLVDLYNTPLSPTGVGPGDTGQSNGDRFWVSGKEGTDAIVGLYFPLSPNGFWFYAPGDAGALDANYRSPISNPVTSAYNQSNGHIMVVDSIRGLETFACRGVCDFSTPRLVGPPEAAVIKPPTGISNFTAAAFAHY